MKLQRPARATALFGGLALFAAWMAAHVSTLTATQSGWVRFVLSLGFAALIVARPKPAPGVARYGSAHGPVLAVIPGTAAVIIGLIFHVGQMEWLGVLLMLWGCLRWSLPASHQRDVTLAMLLLYWAHPLPSILFGPLELGAQWLSVRGAEILLLGLDIRVWADGLVLHTGFRTYEVPAWCSGMRSATTVFLLAWGLAVLHRFRLGEAVVLVLLAVVQAMLLNILRIATMVIFVPRLAVGTEIEYLHNSGGLIVITSVFLVYAEARGWRNRRLKKAATPEDDQRIAHTSDWWHLRSARWVAAGGVLSVALITVMLYRNSTGQRLAVLKDVAMAAQDDENFPLALQLAHAVIARDPADTDWQLKTLRFLLALQQHPQVVAAAETLTGLDERQAHERDILRAYALMAMDRIDEASEIVQALPPAIRNANARVAMILAVVAFRAGDAEGVARHVALASRWKPNEERIRLMYPLLRQQRQWNAIAKTDAPTDYRQPESAFAALEAHMYLDDAARVARITQAAIAAWPEDPRLLEPLYYLAVKRPDSVWESRFAMHFRRSVEAAADADRLYPLFEKAFAFGRPDLAWFLYRRMDALTPGHPALEMALVKHGDDWFRVRRRTLGLPAPTPNSTIDLRAYALLADSFGSWPVVRAWIPACDVLMGADSRPARQAALRRALDRFAQLQADGTLSTPMRYLYAHALELGGRPEEARLALERVAAELPDESRSVTLAISELEERAGRWQEVYEVLREEAQSPEAALSTLLRFARAQLNVRLALGAVETARLARERYPFAALADSMLATALLQHGAPDEALHLIDSPRTRHIRELDILRAKALFATQRYQEVDDFCQRVLLPRATIHAESPQRFALPPAELSRLWHQVYRPSAADFARNAEVLTRNRADTSSPFLRGLMDLWLTCYEGGATTNATPVAHWRVLGRDPVEKAIALNQLTLLLCSSGQYADARAVARQAADLLPTSGTLWRWAVGLAGEDPEVLAAARRACPADPELWLAELVQTAEQAPTALASLTAPALAADATRYPVDALTRAGEFLARREHHDAARALIKAAQARAAGLLPTHIQALRAALIAKDADWAVSSAQQAILSALRPPTSLYRKLVEIKLAGEAPATDFDMVEALKNLRAAEPDNVFWAQLLGYVRFKRGGWEVLDALNQMNAAIEAGSTNRLTFTVASEAARLLGNNERAAEILREGLKQHPGDLAMLNNLAYALTLTPSGTAEAEALLPDLLDRGASDPRVLDTAAAVYTAQGRADDTRAILARQLAQVEPGSPLWFRAQLYEARTQAASGAVGAAITLIESSMRQARELVDEDVVAANRLLSQWRESRQTASATNAPAGSEGE